VKPAGAWVDSNEPFEDATQCYQKLQKKNPYTSPKTRLVRLKEKRDLGFIDV
jgi:hypothetical protein